MLLQSSFPIYSSIVLFLLASGGTFWGINQINISPMKLEDEISCRKFKIALGIVSGIQFLNSIHPLVCIGSFIVKGGMQI